MARSVRPAPHRQEPGQTLGPGNLCNFLTIERPDTGAHSMYGETSSTSRVGSASEAELAERRARALDAANGEDERSRTLAFGAGVAVGALLGAGLALLLAPQSGKATRASIVRGARRIPERARDQWDDLGDELRMALRRRTKGMRRGVRNARWRAADMVEG